jgi:hypothetical protein
VKKVTRNNNRLNLTNLLLLVEALAVTEETIEVKTFMLEMITMSLKQKNLIIISLVEEIKVAE